MVRQWSLGGSMAWCLSGNTARAMNFANGPSASSSLPSLPRRLLSSFSRMTNGTSPRPPNWRLWHPTNGIVFQAHQPQPPYPVLDTARSFAESSSARIAGAESVTMQKSEGAVRSEIQEIRHVLSAAPLGAARASTVMSPLEDIEAGMQKLCVEEIQESTVDKLELELDSLESDHGPPSEPIVSDALQIHNAPFTPLEYSMSHEAFQAAKVAEKGTAGSYWSYSFYRGPASNDNLHGEVRVHYCTNAQSAEEALQHLVGEKLLGFDLEWSALARKSDGVRKNVSLMQIASESCVVLLQLARYPAQDEFATPTLRKLLEDPKIRKIGVWIKGDCSRVERYLGIKVQGQFELSHLYKQVKHCASGRPDLINKRFVSLAVQVEELLGLPMKKDQDVRTSDWTLPLNAEQLGYSASDAYAGVQLFAMLNHQREKLDPCPDLPFHAELGKPIPLPSGCKPPSWADAVSEDDVACGQETDGAAEAKGSNAALTSVDSKTVEKLGAKVQTKRATASAEQAPTPPKDPRVEAAEAWLANYRVGRGLRAAPCALRAYHIWHSNKDLDCASLARILREPPLKEVSVARYILESTQNHDLPYDVDRVKIDVLKHVPPPQAKSWFPTVWQAALQWSEAASSHGEQ